MIQLQSRDDDILLSLRFGIVSEDDLMAEFFETTLIDEAPEEFQEFNIKRNLSVKRKFVANNEELWGAIQTSFGTTDGQGSALKEELVQIARRKGRYLGSQFVAKIKLLDQPIQLTSVQSILEESLASKKKLQRVKNKKQACRKVMKRLIESRLVKSLDKPSRGYSKRYYHLTKVGKGHAQERMHELCMPEQEVVAQNWHAMHAMHAEHDSMVSQVGKTIFALASKQQYEIALFLTESQMKRELMKAQHEFELKWGERRPGIKHYPDLIGNFVFCKRKYAYLIEIDNATQPSKKVLGKTSNKTPMLMICASDDRIEKLIKDFRILGCKAKVYFTTISDFKIGGIFESGYWDFQRGCLVSFS